MFHEKYKLITRQKWLHLEIKLSQSARTFRFVKYQLFRTDISFKIFFVTCSVISGE